MEWIRHPDIPKEWSVGEEQIAKDLWLVWFKPNQEAPETYHDWLAMYSARWSSGDTMEKRFEIAKNAIAEWNGPDRLLAVCIMHEWRAQYGDPAYVGSENGSVRSAGDTGDPGNNEHVQSGCGAG